MTTKSDLVTIDEAVTKYGHSRAWWFDRIKKGDLIAYDIVGRRETFLKEEEIVEMLRPKPRKIGQAGQSEQDAG
jgi:hypothetical protein